MTKKLFLLRHSGSKEGQIFFKIIFTEYPLKDFLLRHSGSKEGQILKTLIFTEYPLKDFLLRHSGSKDAQLKTSEEIFHFVIAWLDKTLCFDMFLAAKTKLFLKLERKKRLTMTKPKMSSD